MKYVSYKKELRVPFLSCDAQDPNVEPDSAEKPNMIRSPDLVVLILFSNIGGKVSQLDLLLLETFLLKWIRLYSVLQLLLPFFS